MRRAKYYIYFNLHKKCFSIKYKGRVICHSPELVLRDVTFSVSQKGRERVLKEKRKNVHAYAVCDSFSNVSHGDYTNISLIMYNPYKYENFVDVHHNRVYNVDRVLCYTANNKGYLAAIS